MDKLRSISEFLPTAFRPPYLHFSLVALAVLLFAFWIFSNRFKFFYHHWSRKRNPPAPFDPRLLRYYRNATLFWLVLVSIGLALLASSFYLTRYQLLVRRVEPAGTATVRSSTVQFVDMRGTPLNARYRGSQVAAGGLFLKFPSWMSVLGLHTYHDLVTFRGNQEAQFHYGKKPDADWIGGYADAVYTFLYRYNDWVKIAQTEYIESVYFPPGKHQLFVTKKGYIVR